MSLYIGSRSAAMATAVEFTKDLRVDIPAVINGDKQTEMKEVVITVPNALSLSMPSTPSGVWHFAQSETFVPSIDDAVARCASEVGQQPNSGAAFHSVPLAGAACCDCAPRDRRFDSFKTMSGRLERQLSNLRGKPQFDPEAAAAVEAGTAVPGVDRYFDALEGPELDTLRASETVVLPEDEKWPFLLRFPINAFGMVLGVSSQAILWKTLATAPSMSFLHVTPVINTVLWAVSVALMFLVTAIYAGKMLLYFEAVRREFYHPVRVNFFFAPWIACLFLVMGVPSAVTTHPNPAAWYALMAPILLLELKIYGHWMSGGQRRLSKVANPSNHLAIVGNFVGALLGANLGLREGPLFFFAVGLAHYLVLFVTLYQRLPTNAKLPRELHPVFFLFVAAPSVASMAWAKIRGDFDSGSRIVYFIALFLYTSLAVRFNFFRGFKFSLSWWAYTFPMTGAAIATIRYSLAVTSVGTKVLAVTLSMVSTVTVASLLITTVVHAFIFKDLFPNDVSIAITSKKPKFVGKILSQLSLRSPEKKDDATPTTTDS